MNKYISGLEVVIGVVLMVIGYVYIITPANSLPQFFPGYDAIMTQTRYAHGAAALIGGIVAFILAAFKNPQRRDN